VGTPFQRDPAHWLRRFSPDEWIRAALAEIEAAERAWKSGDARAGATGAKRAAGMALNGALSAEPDESWGRSYVEHLRALAADETVPEGVRKACRTVLGPDARSELVVLRTPHGHEAILEAARDVIAHAWVVVKRHESRDD
jgi:HEPN domain-containing protein